MKPSIVTLTLNPALDVSSTVEVVSPTHKLRCDLPLAEPGGGGINVTRVAMRLGQPVLAVLPAGGPLGQRVHQLLDSEGVPCVVVPIEGQTRQSITINQTNNGDQYRFVFPGPAVSETEIDACREAVIAAAGNASVLVVSGSMPPGVDDRIIADLVAALPSVKVLVDTSGPAFQGALTSGAYLAKPSASEVSKAVGRPLDTEADVAQAALELVERSNLHAIAVSIGAGGAIVATADGRLTRLRAPAVNVKSAVGAGDSMVAGIAVGLARGFDLEAALALGTASGTATVLSPGTQLCDPADVERLLPLVSMA